MENTNQIKTIMGIPLETYKKLNSEYARINPYSLPNLRYKRQRIMRREVVFSTR